MRTLSEEGCYEELIGRLRHMTPESAARWGRMSAHQMVCHLADACRMALGEKHASEATGLLQQTVVKWIALYTPLPWPPNIQTRPEVDQCIAGTKPMQFDADVAEVARLLLELKTRNPAAPWPRHPIFGPMSRRAWHRWAYRHTDHHLRQFGV